MLKDIELEKPQEFFDLLLEQCELMIHKAQLIHGDLSEFNILVEHQIPYIIDLGQAMSIKNKDDFTKFYDLFERDVTNIVSYFNKRYGLDIDKDTIIAKLELREKRK